MSNRKHVDSKLHGWNGPLFTEETGVVHARFASFFGEIQSHELCKLAAEIEGYHHRSAQHPASDGYIGGWTFTYAVAGGLVAIRTPLFTDAAMEDGTTTDRHTSHYVMGRVNDAVSRLLVGRFANQLAKHPLYGKITAPEAIAA